MGRSSESVRTGLVLSQMGGPGRLEEVEPFIRAIFGDPEVVALPGGRGLRRTVGWAVAKARGRTARAHYRQIGGRSTIREITEGQARAVEAELRQRGHDVVAAVAMRYTDPDTARAVRQLLDAGAQRLVLLPLYPQYSMATTGSSELELRRVVREVSHRDGIDVPLTVVRSWCDHPSYLDATAALISEALAAVPAAHAARTVLVFSAHGLPQRSVDRGDPYPDEVTATMSGVLERIGGDIDSRLSYQSRTGPVRWIEPGTDEVIRELADRCGVAIVVVPISFVSDHVETSYEIDVQLKALAADCGIEHFSRVDVLNDRPGTGAVLADVVEGVL